VALRRLLEEVQGVARRGWRAPREAPLTRLKEIGIFGGEYGVA
jgi:hypothetical protein